MGKRSKDEWLADIQQRQRNIVFPETVENEGRFYRNLWSKKQQLNRAQWMGLLIMFGSSAALLVSLVVMRWPRGDQAWWQRVISAYGLFIVITAVIVALVVIGNRKSRRSKRAP